MQGKGDKRYASSGAVDPGIIPPTAARESDLCMRECPACPLDHYVPASDMLMFMREGYQKPADIAVGSKTRERQGSEHNEAVERSHINAIVTGGDRLLVAP
jgi:hypothetical protein